jgi:hypothetical protein
MAKSGVEQRDAREFGKLKAVVALRVRFISYREFFMSNFFSRAGKSLGVAGALVTISDLMQPIAPFSAYVMAASALALVIILCARFLGVLWNESLAVSTFFAYGVFLLSSILYFYQLSNGSAKEHGVVAENFSVVSQWQEDIGIVERKLDEIVVAIKDVKREVSDDPKKELANKGVDWTSDNFARAVANKHYDLIELFSAGGMKLDSYFFEDYFKHWYTPESAEILVSYGAFSGRECVFSKKNLSFYVGQSADQGRLSALKSACATDVTHDSLRSLRDQLSKEYSSLVKVMGGALGSSASCAKNVLSRGRDYYSSMCCSGQAIPDSGLSFFSATAGGSPSLA